MVNRKIIGDIKDESGEKEMLRKAVHFSFFL
jgi:hypothetical protein